MASVFTDVGEALVVDLLDPDDAQAKLTDIFVAWGTGAGTAAKGDTTLFTEASEDRVAAVTSQPTADVLRCVATITAAGSKTITNAGTFTASTSGTMIVKGDFTGIALDENDAIEFTIDLEFT